MTSAGGVPGERPLPGPENLRIGDAERTDALEALGEHMAAGRLDIQEYSSRTEQAAAARTVTDLRALFTDLPQPHPVLPGPHSATGARASSGAPYGRGQPVARPPYQVNPMSRGTAQRSAAVARGRRVAATLLALAPLTALLLFAATGRWQSFLLIAVAYALSARYIRRH